MPFSANPNGDILWAKGRIESWRVLLAACELWLTFLQNIEWEKKALWSSVRHFAFHRKDISIEMRVHLSAEYLEEKSSLLEATGRRLNNLCVVLPSLPFVCSHQ